MRLRAKRVAEYQQTDYDPIIEIERHYTFDGILSDFVTLTVRPTYPVRPKRSVAPPITFRVNLHNLDCLLDRVR